MIYNNIELHNIDEVHEVGHRDGMRLQRVPEDVRQHLNPGARERVLQPTGGEIRFCSEGQDVQITLSSGGTTDIAIYQGDFFVDRMVLGKDKQTIEVKIVDKIRQLGGKEAEGFCFNPGVMRLVLGGMHGDPVFMHEVSGNNIRPPAAEELPSLRLLSYGTSITQGYNAAYADLGYAAQTAWHLKADLFNLGMAGVALCEPELSDHIASKKDWDIATLALSVNMIGHGFKIDAFYERVRYMVDKVAGADTNRPVFCITIYPSSLDMGPEMIDRPPPAPVEEYRSALRDAVTSCGHPNSHIIEGPAILTDIRGLSRDLCHPSDNGMMTMGRNLADHISAHLAETTTGDSLDT
jgi:hypothetical protein